MMPVGILPRRSTAIDIPVRHFGYFYAKSSEKPLAELAHALENGNNVQVRTLLAESDRNLNATLAEKELSQAASMQHSQRPRAVQELVQNSMDAYGEKGGPMWFRHYHDPSKGQVFEFKDQAGGLPATKFLGLLMTIGATEKAHDAVGGHGQGFKAMFGIGKTLHVASRNLQAVISHDGKQFVARFSRTPRFVDGLHVKAEGVDPNASLQWAVENFCGRVHSKYPIYRLRKTEHGEAQEQVNTTQREDNPDFWPIGEIDGMKVYAQPTHEKYTSLEWTQRGLHIIKEGDAKLPLDITVDLPGGPEYLLERGRDTLPPGLQNKVRKKLGPMIRRYAADLLKKPRLRPEEISFLRRATPLSEKILRYFGMGAGLVAGTYAASLSAGLTARLLGADATLGGLTQTGAYSAPLPKPEAAAGSTPAEPPQGVTLPGFQNNLTGMLTLVGSSIATGAAAHHVYEYLLHRERAGKSNALPVLVKESVARLWEKYRGEVPFAVKNLKILPALRMRKGKAEDLRLSIREAQRLNRRRQLFPLSSPSDLADVTGEKTLELPDGTYMHEDYWKPAEIEYSESERKKPEPRDWSEWRRNLQEKAGEMIRTQKEQLRTDANLLRGKDDGHTHLVRLVQMLHQAANGQAKAKGYRFIHKDENAISKGMPTAPLRINLHSNGIQNILADLDQGKLQSTNLIWLAEHVIEALSPGRRLLPKEGYRDQARVMRDRLYTRMAAIEQRIRQMGIQVIPE